MTSLQAFSSLMESNIGDGDLVLTPLKLENLAQLFQDIVCSLTEIK